MRVLVLGSGGRENALAWSTQKSPLCKKVFIAPGNGGSSQFAERVPLAINDFDAVAQFCIQNKIDLVLVGPENPLVDGIVDYFMHDTALAYTAILGPEKKAAKLEGSKSFAKEFMQKYQIPTAAYRKFCSSEYQQALAYLKTQSTPIVLKADGLAAGKGVRVCMSMTEAESALKEILSDKLYGAAGSQVVIEEFLDGIELSVFALTDGANYVLLPTAKDYKRIGEGDTGLNTGGMGAVSPVPFATEALMETITNEIVKPTIKGIQEERFRYRGFIYFGLMIVKEKPFVIEYNCRMGDPETEAVLPLIASDMFEAMNQAAIGKLKIDKLEFKNESAATVVKVAEGYPEKYPKGMPMEVPENLTENSWLFHMGTEVTEGELQTNGGRVMAVTACAENLTTALKRAYELANQVNFDSQFMRKDIGFDV